MPDDNAISISDIEAARAAMTGGNWIVDSDRNDQANIFAENLPDGCPTDWIAILPHQCVKSIEANQASNAIGICALHAASPTLLAVAKAAMAWRNARTVPGIAAEREAAHALIEALSKVMP